MARTKKTPNKGRFSNKIWPNLAKCICTQDSLKGDMQDLFGLLCQVNWRRSNTISFPVAGSYGKSSFPSRLNPFSLLLFRIVGNSNMLWFHPIRSHLSLHCHSYFVRNWTKTLLRPNCIHIIACLSALIQGQWYTHNYLSSKTASGMTNDPRKIASYCTASFPLNIPVHTKPTNTPNMVLFLYLFFKTAWKRQYLPVYKYTTIEFKFSPFKLCTGVSRLLSKWK